MAPIEPERKGCDSGLNDYEVIEEEIVESSSTSDDVEDDDESTSNENIISKDDDDSSETVPSKQKPNVGTNSVIDEESNSSVCSSNLKTKTAIEPCSIDGYSAVANESSDNDKLVKSNDSDVSNGEKSTLEKIADVDQKSDVTGSSNEASFKSFSRWKSLMGKSASDDTVDSPKTDDDLNDDAENDVSSSQNIDSSAMSNASGDETNDFNDETMGDEVDMSDVSSSIAENENIDVPAGKTATSQKPRKRSRQPPIMIGYRKRRKVQHAKKPDEESGESVTKMAIESENDSIDVQIFFRSAADCSVDDDKSESSRKSLEQSSSEENLNGGSPRSTRSMRKFSGSCFETACADKYCWICHKDGGNMLKCIACPRVYHTRCHMQASNIETMEDPSNFHCPECSAVLKADNVNTRSPVLVTVNLEQLCTLLKHIINMLKAQKDSHFFWGPVDTKEFPHYREYVVYPMDISVLEKNVKNKIYGCTEAFIADVKWIVHNSIVFNSKAAKITNVAKNLLKICKREIQEIETCAECYYNSLVRRDTWFIEVCKRPHLLVWAKLKGYPPWPAKAMKYKEGNVDCRFFGAHDKAWVPLKDCFLYSKITPQPVKVKRGSHLEGGIQELEKHIKKLKDKYGIFVYPVARIPYSPSQEVEQIRMMLPNYNPSSSIQSTKYLIHPDRVKSNLKPKTLFEDSSEKTAKEESGDGNEDEKPLDEMDCESMLIEDLDKHQDSAPHDSTDDSNSSSSENENSVMQEVSGEQLVKESQSSTKSSIEKDLKNSVVESVESSPATPPTTAVEAATSASTSPARSPDKANGVPEKSDDVTKVRKLVSVKNIESINATVVSGATKTKPVDVLSKNVSSSEPNLLNVVRKQEVTALKPTSSVVDTFRVSKSPTVEKQKSIIATSEQVSKPASRKNSDTKNGSEEIICLSSTCSTDMNFDLNKVKDEPLDNGFSDSEKSDQILVDKTSPLTGETKTDIPNLHSKTKRSIENDDDVSAKKSKTDSTCRTVNITENVTLSLINQTASADVDKPRIITNTKPKPVKPLAPATRVVYGVSHSGETNTNMKMKTVPAVKSVASVNTNHGTAVNKATFKVQSRALPNQTYANDSHTVPSKTSISVISPITRVSAKPMENHSNTIRNLVDDCTAKFVGPLTKIIEEALEEHAGKGNLQAKIIMLQQELQTMKRNHELMIDELKRDYEVQIAELRATSIAKTQFDIASERLKFEQEKERAVKEAKSKQWCSNCQKSANYYCCWNTAYCDFECQKDHWIQHMHVCKNDVKKKTPESSENEPPRIMMQNDDSSNYLLNGYDKTNSTYYQNTNSGAQSRNNFNRIQLKSTNSIRAPRPLLPRVTATVSSTQSSIPSPSVSLSVSGTAVVGSSHSTYADNNGYQNLCNNGGGTSTLRPSAYNSLNNHSFLRQQTTQYHK